MTQKKPSKMKFIGRTREQKRLTKLFSAHHVQAALIYGRRRVGKSDLIKHCLKTSEIKSIYYECKQTTEKNNVDSLAMIISDVFGFPKLAFASMEEALVFLFQQAVRENLIVVLDEYSYLSDAVRGMDSILQHLIDQYRETSQLKLVLCGSFIDTMRSMLLVQNPLYGRIDLTIDLKPMDYYDSAQFYPDFSNEDKVRLYSVFGGIPYYNRLIDPDYSVRENIIALVASVDARLENEVGMYLRSELSKITNANEVFETLAKGFSRYSDILSQSHVSSSPALADTLDKLIAMEVVKKEAPINAQNNRKRSGYYISDNLSLFYYRYIFRYLSQMNVMGDDAFYDRYIAEDFETVFVPHQFETICRQFLIRQNRAGRIAEPFEKIGKYYYDDPKTKTNGKFDIVTEDEKGYIFYEAKFRKNPVNQKMIETEIEQVNQTKLKAYCYGFVSRSGFADDVTNDVIKYDLNDLYRHPD